MVQEPIPIAAEALGEELGSEDQENGGHTEKGELVEDLHENVAGVPEGGLADLGVAREPVGCRIEVQGGYEQAVGPVSDGSDEKEQKERDPAALGDGIRELEDASSCPGVFGLGDDIKRLVLPAYMVVTIWKAVVLVETLEAALEGEVARAEYSWRSGRASIAGKCGSWSWDTESADTALRLTSKPSSQRAERSMRRKEYDQETEKVGTNAR